MPGGLASLSRVAARLRDDEIHVWHLAYRQGEGRAPLHRVLGAYLGIGAERVRLVDEEHGRPALADAHRQPLGFNWSHSGEDALIAIGSRITPGVDIERLRPRPRALAIAHRYFCADEAAQLEALLPEQRDAAFLELWTAKEAVLKALGRGIAFGLDRLSVIRAANRLSLQQLDGDDVDAWQLQRLAIAPGLIASLAWRGDPRRVHVATLASDD